MCGTRRVDLCRTLDAFSGGERMLGVPSLVAPDRTLFTSCLWRYVRVGSAMRGCALIIYGYRQYSQRSLTLHSCRAHLLYRYMRCVRNLVVCGVPGGLPCRIPSVPGTLVQPTSVCTNIVTELQGKFFFFSAKSGRYNGTDSSSHW